MCENNSFLVAKESRHELPYAQRLDFHIESTACQARAATLAGVFNRALDVALALAGEEEKKIEVIDAAVYRLLDPTSPGSFRYLAVERMLPEEAYTKFNSNNGFVNEHTSDASDLAQASSHFSYDYTFAQELVCDLQGTPTHQGITVTDPQLHSVSGTTYGRADRGIKGIQDFFKTHRCNAICDRLRLPQPNLPS